MLYGCVETTFDGCLGSKFGDDILSIYVRIISETTRISWKVIQFFFFVAQIIERSLLDRHVVFCNKKDVFIKK